MLLSADMIKEKDKKRRNLFPSWKRRYDTEPKRALLLSYQLLIMYQDLSLVVLSIESTISDACCNRIHRCIEIYIFFAMDPSRLESPLIHSFQLEDFRLLLRYRYISIYIYICLLWDSIYIYIYILVYFDKYQRKQTKKK